ncbi:MoaD/ThiS family protein [Clostridium bowmanii]|uniref:MoaD/ThiS family protein n=1 Tax=Clostridium bowmanii TaxID=132925 RepID=UPI001C0DE00A|nr:MoaD/ThiS family protein [Clostridium bowmanii]MBU3190797.1 MoaD/ThiS family protein [Clostridium bowmanii]MCA1075299.1 MoaD/ThiS family protein [Clostridium bowmanii]
MKITVKLFATFRDGREKIQFLDVEQGKTTEDVITILGIEKSEVAILLLNGRDEQFDRPLVEGDLIALFPPVGGG